MTSLLSQLQQTLDVAPPELASPPYMYNVTGTVDRFREWKHWRDFAEHYFPGATRLEVMTDSESNDEGGYYTTVSSVTAYDAANNIIGWDDEQHGDMWDVLSGEEAPEQYSVFYVNEFPKSPYPKESLLASLDAMRQWVEGLPTAAFFGE